MVDLVDKISHFKYLNKIASKYLPKGIKFLLSVQIKLFAKPNTKNL